MIPTIPPSGSLAIISRTSWHNNSNPNRHNNPHNRTTNDHTNTHSNTNDVVILKNANPLSQGLVCKRLSSSTTKRIKNGHVWVEGDNPSNSLDSRSYGSVESGLIVGRVVCVIGLGWIKIF